AIPYRQAPLPVGGPARDRVRRMERPLRALGRERAPRRGLQGPARGAPEGPRDDALPARRAGPDRADRRHRQVPGPAGRGEGPVPGRRSAPRRIAPVSLYFLGLARLARTSATTRRATSRAASVSNAPNSMWSRSRPANKAAIAAAF